MATACAIDCTTKGFRAGLTFASLRVGLPFSCMAVFGMDMRAASAQFSQHQFILLEW